MSAWLILALVIYSVVGIGTAWIASEVQHNVLYGVVLGALWPIAFLYAVAYAMWEKIKP